MGLGNSKSPLERRNTVARRSQRRTLHNLKSKVDNLHKDIKKFKGITEDTNYVKLKNEIEYFKNDLGRRKKDLQPQVRALYETVYKRLNEADEALINKLQENQEKQEKKDAKEAVSSVGLDDVSEVEEQPQSVMENETVVDVHQENEENKRQTVEINLVKVIPEDGKCLIVMTVSNIVKKIFLSRRRKHYKIPKRSANRQSSRKTQIHPESGSTSITRSSNETFYLSQQDNSTAKWNVNAIFTSRPKNSSRRYSTN